MFENVQITTLPNGSRIATSAMPGVNSCSVSFSVAMGSRCEKASEAGWSHFVEHMLFKGSAKRPTQKELIRPLERIGGLHNAYTGCETTSAEACVPAHGTAIALDVLGDMIAHPQFPADKIDVERKVIVEEIKRGFDNPSARTAQISREALWPKHPLGRQIVGTEKSLSSITAEALHAFHAKHYTSRGALVVAAGKLEHDSIVEWVRPFLESLPDAPATTFQAASRAGAVQPVVMERRDTQQAQVSISTRCFGHGDPRRYALYLLSAILGGGISSRLFRSIRDRHGLAYDIHSYPLPYSDTGAFHVRGGFDSARLEKAIALCGRELRKVAQKPVGKQELSDAKERYASTLLVAGETTFAQASLLEQSIHDFGRVVSPEEEVEQMRAITREDIQALAAEIFRPENMTLALVLPAECKADPEALRRALVAG